jgi:hypothetical protein
METLIRNYLIFMNENEIHLLAGLRQQMWLKKEV